MQSEDVGLIPVAHALLSEKSVTRAAARLHLSVSATSRALDRCRTAFGDPLLVRAGRELTITPGGEELLNRLEPLVSEIETLFDREADFSPQTLNASFTIRAGEVVIATLSSALIDLVRADAPDVEVQFAAEAADDIPALRADEAQLAIGSYSDLTPDLRSEVIADESLVGVLDADHPLAGARITAARFADMEHIDVSRFGKRRKSVDQLLAKAGKKRSSVTTVPSFSAALLACIGSRRTALVPRRLAARFDGSSVICTYKPPIPLPGVNVVQAWHTRHDSDPGHQWLRACVRSAASASPIGDKRVGNHR